jgi:hypothetical protein
MSILALALLNGLYAVGTVNDAARMHLDRIEATDCQHPRGRDGKRGVDGADAVGHGEFSFQVMK